MSALVGLLVLIVALGGGLLVLPWVGLMALFVVLTLGGALICRFRGMNRTASTQSTIE